MSTLSYPPITQWGHPSASKRALCIHGMIGTSTIWHYIASSLVNKGYLVTAPDLLGHGLAPASTDYTIKAFADALLPLLSATGPYDLVIGTSLGAIVALALLPHLSGPLRVILVDPPLEMSPDALEVIRMMATGEVTGSRTVEQDIKERNYTKEDAVWRNAGRCLCEASTIDSILQQNMPWSQTYRLPGPSPTQSIIILAADPSVFAVFSQEQAAELKRSHPHIKTRLVKGAGHDIYIEIGHRDVIVEAALEV